MPYQVRGADGRIYTVHTEVGDGLARVIVQEQEQEEVSMEGNDDE